MRRENRPRDRRVVGPRDARRRDIGQYKPIQVVPHRDFAALAALLLEPQHVLRAVATEVAQAELGDRPGPAGSTAVSVPGNRSAGGVKPVNAPSNQRKIVGPATPNHIAPSESSQIERIDSFFQPSAGQTT